MKHVNEVVARIPLFSGLTPEQLDRVTAIAISQRLGKDETVFTEGDAASGFFVVIEGRVNVYKLSPEGKEHILHLFGAGQPFGEVPVFAGENFPAHAQTITPSRLLFFPRDAFVALITAHPALALKMMAVLSHRLRAFTRQIENLSLKEVPGRLASYLLSLHEIQGGSATLNLTISKTLLAGILGTIPETLSRIFRRLSQQEIIAVQGREIQILDLEKLRDLSETGREGG